MPRSVGEIMNRELLAVAPEAPAQAVRNLFRVFAVSAVPVLDENRRPLGVLTATAVIEDNGSAGERMVRPAVCVEGSTAIEVAARRLALADVPHLVVVDTAGAAVGVVSTHDLLRALLGVPTHHPSAFPHWDAATQASWTDEWSLDKSHICEAPDGAGVLVLVRGSFGQTDAIVWAEACPNVRRRVASLLALSASAEPALARLLERKDLRFRAAVVPDEDARERIVSSMRSDLEHRPEPGAT